VRFLLCLVAIAHAAPRWAWVFKAGVAAAMLCGLGLFAFNAYRHVPRAHEGRGLLSARWARAATVLPDARECRVFVMDPPPFMLHRMLEPTSPIPLSLEEFETVARNYPALCVVVLDRHLRLSSSAERRRKKQDAVVAALKAQQRLERVNRAEGVTVYRMRPPSAS
jgi:hypothetical protein